MVYAYYLYEHVRRVLTRICDQILEITPLLPPNSKATNDGNTKTEKYDCPDSSCSQNKRRTLNVRLHPFSSSAVSILHLDGYRELAARPEVGCRIESSAKFSKHWLLDLNAD